MKKSFAIVVSALALFCSCNNTETPSSSPDSILPQEIRKQNIARIKNLEKEMHKSVVLDNVTATLAIKAYDDFAKLFPEDSLAPDFLFKAGEITTATKQYPQSLMYYKNITTNYPKNKLVDVSLYLQGVLLDNYLNDDAKAKIIYEEVIAKYPTSQYANDAKAAINNLGKSDEELIKEFEKKNKKK